MSIETNGALNRLTAAALTIAVTIEKKNGKQYTAARDDIQHTHDEMTRSVLDN